MPTFDLPADYTFLKTVTPDQAVSSTAPVDNAWPKFSLYTNGDQFALTHSATPTEDVAYVIFDQSKTIVSGAHKDLGLFNTEKRQATLAEFKSWDGKALMTCLAQLPLDTPGL